MLIVEPAHPMDPAPRALLKQSHDLMQQLFMPEDNFFLGFDALCSPDVYFVTARDGTEMLATGALVQMEGYCEIKLMFTSAKARRRGAGAAILRALEDHARNLGFTLLRLETGAALESAIRLYERQGFTRCARFGDYTPNEVSVYMEKSI